MLSFDTLTHAKRLQEAGVPARQAEAHAGALKELVEDNLATKRDLKELEVALRHDMKEMESRIVLRLGGIVVGGFTLTVALFGVVIAMIAL